MFNIKNSFVLNALLVLLMSLFVASCSSTHSDNSSSVSVSEYNLVPTDQPKNVARVNEGQIEIFRDLRWHVNCYVLSLDHSNSGDRISCTYTENSPSVAVQSKEFPLKTQFGSIQRTETHGTADICYTYLNNRSYDGTSLSCVTVPNQVAIDIRYDEASKNL